MPKGDEFYEKSMEGATSKAEHKVANLMKHGYEMQEPVQAILLNKGISKMIILPNGDAYLKCLY